MYHAVTGKNFVNSKKELHARLLFALRGVLEGKKGKGERNMYDAVMGWDFGHGENSVCLIRSSEKLSEIILNLDANKNRELISVILYQGDEIKIGNEAKAHRAAVPYFKERPALWDVKIAGRTKRDMMYDYFRTLMKNLREFNPDCLYDDDRILLLVGCPTSDDWQEPPNAYRDMVKYATGVADVKIIPESRAALFSAFSPYTRTKANTAKGAVVFDLGSSTLDFTYMLLGKEMLERSCTLGASHIERGMLRAILADAGFTPGDVWDKEIGSLELELRMQKERFYAEGVDRPYVVALTELDDDGDPVMTQDRKGRTIEKKKNISYNVDEAFMEDIVDGEMIRIESNGADMELRSWSGHLREFFIAAKAMLDHAETPLPYETIILTGGASRMPFVKKLCEEVFGKEAFMEANPSHSVSKGLCYLGMTDQRLPGLLEKGRKELRAKADENFNRMLEGCVNEISGITYERIAEVLKDIAASSSDCTIGELGKKIRTEIETALSQEKMRKILGEYFNTWMAYCKEDIINATNRAAKEFYPDAIDASHFQIRGDMVASFDNSSFTLSEGNSGLVTLDFTSLANKVINQAIAAAIAIVVAALSGPFAVVTSAIAYAIALGIADAASQKQDKKLDSKMRSKISASFEKEKTKRLAEIEAKVTMELMNSMREMFGEKNEKVYDQLDDSLRDAFDVITLRKFGNRKVSS